MSRATTAPAAGALELRALQQRFGRTEVLRGVSLSLRAGERLALIGPNGAGKTTLFDIASGRRVPSGGQVLLDGRRIDGLPPHRIHRLGLARSFQASSLFARLSAFENLRCAVLWSQGCGHAFWRLLSQCHGANAMAERQLALIGLAHRRDVPAGELPYAEQRALELGIATAGRPRVVLLDEPTAGMSRSQTQQFVALIRRLTEGCTLLMVEHDMSVVFELADRVAVLAGGELIALDAPQAVRADARVREAYLGTALAPATPDGVNASAADDR